MKIYKKTIILSISFLLIFAEVLTVKALDASTLANAGESLGFMAFAGIIMAYMPSVSTVLGEILNWLLKLFTFLSVISFIITGIMFLFSGSNPELREKAKSGIVYSTIGITAGLSGYIIIKTISELLSASI